MNNDSLIKQTFNFKGNNASIYLSNSDIDKNNENIKEDNKFKNTNILSFKARKLLKSAAESEGIIYTDNNKEKLFCGDLIIDFFNISVKEKTEWIGSLEELLNNEYIFGNNDGFYNSFSYKNSFEITPKGFEFYYNYYKNNSVNLLTYNIIDEYED